jgi:hypothetical protein
MDSTRQVQEQAQVVPGDTEQLTTTQEQEEEEDYFSTDPDVIFRREYSKLETIPLKQAEPTTPWPSLLLFAAFFLSVVGGAVLGIVTYPNVTIDLVPVTKRVTITAQLPLLQTRMLAPVTLTKTETAPTTGHGHQDARTATGHITLYNGQLQSVTIACGTLLTGRDGIHIAITQDAVIPAADPTTNPPTFGQVSVSAQAVQTGADGNIPAFDLNGSCCAASVIVKNLAPFTNGRDARDFQTVAQADLDGLTATVRQQLTQSMPQAFHLSPGEQVTPTHCILHASADHGIAEEARTVTVNASYTCKGIAYDSQQLQRSAATAFTATTRPEGNYELVGSVQTSTLSVLPVVTASLRGLWVYLLSEDYQQFLAEQLAGDSSQQARAYLLATGFITRVTVPAGQLPKDPGHIHFETLIGL